MGKKVLTLMVVSVTAFAGTVQALANSAGYAPQAELYHKSVVDMTYSVCCKI